MLVKRVKKIVTFSLSLSLLVMYMIASMGMGLHECSHDGTSKLIVFFGESPCSYAHSHIDTHGHLYTHTHLTVPGHFHKHLSDGSVKEIGNIANTTEYQHDGHCCKTTAFVLSHEQKIQDYRIMSAPLLLCIGVLSDDYFSLKSKLDHFGSNYFAYCRGDEPVNSQVSLSLISQLLI